MRWTSENQRLVRVLPLITTDNPNESESPRLPADHFSEQFSRNSILLVQTLVIE